MKHIEDLLEKYLDGTTTRAEEQELRQFFSTTADVPQQWRVFRALFAYEAAEHQPASLPAAASGEAASGARRPARRLWIYAASVAACAAILLAVALSLPRKQRDFAVIDGQVVTSRAVVAAEAEEALLLIGSGNGDDFSALDLMK